MSRIGKKPIAIPSGVTATVDGGQLSVKGPKGTLAMDLVDDVTYTIEGDSVSVTPANETKRARAFWGKGIKYRGEYIFRKEGKKK
jgi:large subunit ribosomal protein L6